MRFRFILPALLTVVFAVLTARGVTPVVGKDKLRKLVKLPSISFKADFVYDLEQGFTLGSGEQDATTEIRALRKGMKRDVSDAESYERLGDLYASISQDKNAKVAWGRAVELYRKRVEMQPGDGALLAGLGHSLQGVGRSEEAESVLRQAVQLAPKAWKGWVALGRFLDMGARREIYDKPSPAVEALNGAVVADRQAINQLSPNQVSLARRRMDEAGDCYEKAVAAGPDESEVYFRRGMHRALRHVLLNQIRLAAGEQREDVDALGDCFSQESLADLQHASQLSPQDYQLMGGTAVFEIYTVSARNGRMNWKEFSWNSLPDKSQRSIRATITRLENLAQSPEPQLAAGALEVLGVLQGPILHERRNCIATLRRALALDPSREQSWEMIAGMQVQTGDYAELLSTCEDRIKEKDAARSHFLMAKAYEKLRQWDSSEEQILIAVKQDANSITSNLGLAALLLKRSEGDASVLADANTWLTRAEYLYNKAPAGQKSQGLIIDLTLTRVIYFALTDDVDTARQWAKAVIAVDKENNLAQEILSALEY
ncbi:MAG: Tetratricopeptide 2 repeat protein [Pedosphaera sp.]|nr:Tetratricopeptide 2 repeat protein [Pedosphaera sp.]